MNKEAKQYKRELTKLKDNLEKHESVVLSGVEHENIDFVIKFTLPTIREFNNLLRAYEGNLKSIEDLVRIKVETEQLNFSNLKTKRGKWKWNKRK